MDDATLDIRTDILVLRMVTASAWANFLANGGDDPVADCRHIAAQMAEVIKTSSDAPTGSGEIDVLNRVLEKVERFWGAVEEQLVGNDTGHSPTD